MTSPKQGAEPEDSPSIYTDEIVTSDNGSYASLLAVGRQDLKSWNTITDCCTSMNLLFKTEDQVSDPMSGIRMLAETPMVSRERNPEVRSLIQKVEARKACQPVGKGMVGRSI